MCGMMTLSMLQPVNSKAHHAPKLRPDEKCKMQSAKVLVARASAGIIRDVLVVLCGYADKGDGHGDFGLLLFRGLWRWLLLRNKGIFVCGQLLQF